MDIKEIINSVYEIPQYSLDTFIKNMQIVLLPKGSRPIIADKRCYDIYFIRKGIARAFYSVDGKEITFWIGAEGSTLFSINSIVDATNGYETIELLEDCELYHIAYTDMQTMFDEDIHITNWGIRFFEKLSVMTEKRLISLSFNTATQRYVDLLQHHPDLLLRVPINQLATYLGITPVSMSRIRANFYKNTDLISL